MQWPKIRIGTRSSALARVQVNLLSQALCHAQPDLQDAIEIVYCDTPGDRDRSSSLEELGGRGVFTDDLDYRVASGDIDCVVHAMKDMAPGLHDGLVIGATLQREDPREVLVAPGVDSFDAVPQKTVFGSSSIRRRALLRRLRPDLQFTLLRGNVEERIAQVRAGVCEATILAYAGLSRLGLLDHASDVLSLDVLPPDPAQGAIGIVCRGDNFPVRRVLQMINHKQTFAEITAERALLNALPTPDALAIGGVARVCDQRLTLSALLVSDDGSREWAETIEGHKDDAAVIGARLGSVLRAPAQRLLSA